MIVLRIDSFSPSDIKRYTCGIIYSCEKYVNDVNIYLNYVSAKVIISGIFEYINIKIKQNEKIYFSSIRDNFYLECINGICRGPG